MPGNIGDFKELIENSRQIGLFVDKSLLIQSIIDSKTDPLLITRPRRWGKTINMSMLFYFFVHREQLIGMGKSTEFIKQCNDLFTDLNIFTKNANATSAKNYIRKYPTIFISFAGSVDDSGLDDITKPDWHKIKGLIIARIAELFTEFYYVAENLKKTIDRKFNQEFNLTLEQKISDYKQRFNTINLSDAERIKIYEEVQIDKSVYPEQLELDKFNRLSRGEPKDSAELSDSINFLAKLLNKLHVKPVYIFIDEYDSLINKYFNQKEILDELTSTFSGIFSAFAKPTGMINDYIQKVVFTGILRVAKANIFSGLNNLSEETILDYKLSEYYGFLEEEVNILLDKASIINKQEIKSWYNGYIAGANTVYNPWSIMQCIAHAGNLEPYWVGTANPKMLKDLLINKSSREDKQLIRNLIKYQEAILDIDLKKQVSFDDLQNNPAIIWSLLIHTGYLTLMNINNKRHVQLPNKEVALLIKDYVDNWFIEQSFLSKTANSLLTGDFYKFEEALKEIFSDPAYSARIFSGGGRAAKVLTVETAKEFVYQFLIMTELRCINLSGNSEYEVFAEIEDVSIGKTRPDILVVNHKQKLCIVGEIKVSLKANEDLKKLAIEGALAQIDKNQYGKIYQEKYGYKILPLGIAFRGDNFQLAY
jgi:hypothetical protein